MWIIPKTLSAFVPATPGWSWESSELAWMFAQSLMWRSKHSAAPTWLRRLKKGGWITHLSGRILKPSLHESFVEKYTDSLEDILVNHSVQQASDKEKKTQDTYGHTSSSTSGQLEMFSGASLRMLQDTPRWGYGESCPIWKKKVTERRGAYSARKKLALHTKGNECSSWPTAQTSDSNGAADPTRKAHRTQLRYVETGHLPQGKNWATPTTAEAGKISNQANYGQQGLSNHPSIVGLPKRPKGEKDRKKNWATPQASDHIEGARTAKESNQKCLGRDLNQMNWATPNTMDYMETRSAEGVEKIASGARKGRKRPSNLREQVDKKTCDIYKEQNWPTPRAGNPGSRKPGTGGKILAEEAKIHNGPPALEKSNTSGKNLGSWPTPRVGGHEKAETSIKRGRGVSLTGAVAKDATQTPKLNPNWVEQLMGLSTGWTDLGSWGTESSPKPQK